MARPLKEVRQEQGIGVRRLSRGAPVSPRTVITTEKGESVPSLETIRKISRYLGLEDPMEVTEFRAALEAQGLDALPEEPAPPPLASPPPVASLPPHPASGVPPYEVLPLGHLQGQDFDLLLGLMRELGARATREAYRRAFGQEMPPEGET